MTKSANENDAVSVGLPILTAGERYKVPVEWNQTQKDYPRDKCVHQLFEEQVERTPEALAVVFGEEQLTYRELNNRANQLAHKLRSMGVGPEVLVGICVERSLEMVIGLLGILKAGGAYVPLDPEYPKERLTFMLKDADAPVLLTQDSIMGKLPRTDARVICLDVNSDLFVAENRTNPMLGVTPDNLIYVIYTSGSTENPKGAGVHHRGFLNLVHWFTTEFGISSGDVVLLMSSFSFDLTQKNIYGALIRGGTLQLLPSGSYNPRTIVDLIRRHRITLLNCTPSAFYPLIESKAFDAGNDLSSLRYVFLGGESISVSRLRPWIENEHNCATVVNTYGPTECTDIVASYQLDRFNLKRYDLVPIGKPLPNIQLIIVDGELRLCPLGVAGELCVAGIGVGTGYINNPELTAAKFVVNPFPELVGNRLYRTGDLCRYLPDGNIEFIGRMDHQVKIRGFRIELGEIESVLASHPRVQSAVVMAREDKNGDKQLVGYVVAKDGKAPTTSDFRDYLKQKLPEYMVPGVFVGLKAFPLTPNGKIDRKALPASEEGRIESGTEYVAPRTAIEQKLAAIWSEVLGVEKIGIHDNFFQLGGHSLNAVKIVTRIQSVLNRELPPRMVVGSATIEKLAEAVEQAVVCEQNILNEIQNAAMPAASGSQLPRSVVPASFNQAQLWFLQQLNPSSVVYNLGHIIRFDGMLNFEALRASLTELIRRHESLRATFESVNGEPMQEIKPPHKVKLEVTDLRHLAEGGRESELQRMAAMEMALPFDLAHGPLVRWRLVRLDEQQHALLFGAHHIIYDGWSNDVLLHDLKEAYEAFCCRGDTRLPDLAVQYSDFTAWQRQQLKPEVVERHLAFWRKQLAGVPTLLEMPMTRVKVESSAARREQQSFRLSGEATTELRALSRKQNCTLFVTLLAAFQALLHRHGGQECLLVGAPFAGRLRKEVENIIGYFVNSLPIKADFSKDPSFTKFLEQVRDAVWEAQEHQELPFEQLVEEFQPVRQAHRNPLFQVLLAFEVPVAPRKMTSLTLTIEEVPQTQPMFDLTLAVAEREGLLECVLSYDSARYDNPAISLLLEHFQCLLAGIVAEPERKISALPVMSASERHKLLVEWNDTKRVYPRDKCVHELFEEQVERTPEAVAVAFGEKQLTYQELNNRANQLAHRLRSMGVGPEVLVGICVERSLEMVIGLLGILKAGGAYVPLEPDQPGERLAFMLGETKVPVLLTQTKLAAGLPENGARVICLDNLEQASSPLEESANPASGSQPNHLAYVMYTSGSTGRPKAIEIPHRGVVRLVKGDSYASFGSDEVFLQMAPLAFDASTFEIWGPLLNGGRLVVVSPGAPALEEIGRVIRESGVTTLWLTAGLFHLMAEQRLDDLKPLRQLLAGGDVLALETVRRVARGLKGCRVFNGYGPTESTTFACCYEIQEKGLTGNSVPIGRPIANTQVYILDASLEPVPIGVAGELHIGGDGLARGYLNRPELTAEKFIPNPFSDEPDARLYKTGDLCRYLPDGNIEFIGRMDHQVKIRGFRIELGEIESVLVSHPRVQSAVVMAREDKNGDKQLVGYVVAKDGMAPTTTDLRDHLKQKLPDYMVPGVFVGLKAFPLTPNGKIDRKALPSPEEGRIESGTEYVAPRTETERKLAAIWSEVLGVEKIGIHDNFFQLGGHSLMATKVISRVLNVFQTNVPLRAIFEAPTIAGFVRVVEKELRRPESEEDLDTLLKQIEEMTEDEARRLTEGQS